MKKPVGLQVYTVRDFAEQNFAETCKKIAEMGYDFLELAGLYGHTFAEVKAAADAASLPIYSAHVALAEFENNGIEETVKNFAGLGCKYIAIPYMPAEMRYGTDRFAYVMDLLVKIGTACMENDVVMLYHNHDFEFAKMEDGRFVLDYMYETIPADLLQTELDTCWVKVAGQSPEAYIQKYQNRCPVVHLKDFVGQKSENMYELIGIDEGTKKEEKAFEFRPVGSGVQNFPAILEACENNGAEYVVVEQDKSYGMTSLESAQKSREYLKSLGW